MTKTSLTCLVNLSEVDTISKAPVQASAIFFNSPQDTLLSLSLRNNHGPSLNGERERSCFW